MDIEDNKSVYNRNVCKWCKYNSTCNHNKFVVVNMYGRINMRCSNYEYNKQQENL